MAEHSITTRITFFVFKSRKKRNWKSKTQKFFFKVGSLEYLDMNWTNGHWQSDADLQIRHENKILKFYKSHIMTFWPRESQNLDLDGQKEFDSKCWTFFGMPHTVCVIPYASNSPNRPTFYRSSRQDWVKISRKFLLYQKSLWLWEFFPDLGSCLDENWVIWKSWHFSRFLEHRKSHVRPTLWVCINYAA